MDALVSGLQSRANTSQIKQIVRECGTELKSKTLTNMAGAYTHGYSTGRTARTTSLDFSDGGLTAKVKPTTEAQYLNNSVTLVTTEVVGVVNAS